jgi:tRNA nucleotidyltransferase (CCA-adding enzyme)
VMMVVDYAAKRGWSLPVRFAALTHDLGKGTTPPDEWPHHHGHEVRSVELVTALAERLKAPAECRDLALITARFHGDVSKALELRPATLLKVLEGADAFRRPERFEEFLQACSADFHGRTGFESRPYPQAKRMAAALAAARAVDAGAIAANVTDPAQIGARVHEARVAAIRTALDHP